jgi:hypothetical protein
MVPGIDTGGGGFSGSSSSGVGGGDQWWSSGADFGVTNIGSEAGSGLSLSTPVLIAGMLVAAFVILKVVK